MRQLLYRGEDAHDDGRFVVQPGEVVEFSDAEAERRLSSEQEQWKEVSAGGTGRKGRRTVQK